MEIDTTQRRILSTALNLPVFGFYHGVLMAFSDYFKARPAQFSELLLNRRPGQKLTKYRRYLDKVRPLVRENYLQVIANSTPGAIFGRRRAGVNAIFKATDRAWRTLGNNGDPRRRHQAFEVTCTSHDMKAAAVLLALQYGMGFALRRPLDWRDSQGPRAPLPDGVIVSKTGEELAVEFERGCDRRHLEKHIRSYTNGTRVILVHEHLNKEVGALTLELFQRHNLRNWYFTFFAPLVRNGGRGPYYDWCGNDICLSD
jgi:hypothetical protein